MTSSSFASTLSPLLCLYAEHAPHDPAAWLAALPEDLPRVAFGAAAAPFAALGVALWQGGAASAASGLVQLAAAYPGRPLLLLNTATVLPCGWWPRLCAAAHAATDAVVSPLSGDTPDWDPRPLDHLVGAIDCDAAVWASGARECVGSNDWSTLCSLWPAAAAAALQADGGLPVGVGAWRYTGLFIGDGRPPRSGTRSPSVAALAERIRPHLDRALPHFGLDGRPVLLHVVHGWGGGAERFVRDYASADTRFRHLMLRAESAPTQRRHGVALCLHDDLSQPALQRWPLLQPIDATALNHAEYAALLTRLRADYGVSAVLVSSLIGHSLDALRSGLPTACVCHDYYPLWPQLHADFANPQQDFGAAAIPAALATRVSEFEFRDTRPAYWQHLRTEFVTAVEAADARLIAPSRGVLANWQRIEPALAKRPWQVIEHGLAAWPALPERGAPPPDRLRLLVPGRIRGGKGEDLLAALLRDLPAGIELVLLGSGAAGMGFFGSTGVHVRLNYQRDELPALLAEIRPHAALLLSTVAETFSYTLSEMRSLGVPVIATRRGSFVERIDDGRDGLLVDADAAALRALLVELRDAPQRLASLVCGKPPDSLETMAARYATTLASATTMPTCVQPGTLEAGVRIAAETQAAGLKRQVAQLRAMTDTHQRELERRADWAQHEAKVAADRLRWAEQLDAELGRVRSIAAALESERARLEQAWQDSQAEAARLQAEGERLSGERDALQRTLDHERAELNRYIAALIQQRDQFEAERNAILNSTSWRLTKPLRYARRLAGGALARGKFRLQKLRALQHRGWRSLKARGLIGTWRRLLQEFRPAQPNQAFELPAATHDIDGIVLPQVDTPRASIIVPAYNHIGHSLTCLRALAAQAQRTPFEVILVDDCSQDDTATLLPKIPNLRYQRNAQNLGFIGACNAGAALARGEFVVFLNNDTAVQAGWLDALLETFATHDRVGLVGAKLVYPDGRLQEAGGIVFADGSGWNYGRFDDPADPRYNYVREVDYCSGAAIALPTALFKQLGGFDAHYAPAYYEDTDLAMQVRQAGYRVLYQPKSVVVHFEGVTSGTDTGSGTKRFQVINQGKFLERWSKTLATHAEPGTDILIAREHRQRRRVLVIDATTPQPDQDSGSVRLVNLLRLLREDCAVTFFADNRAWVERYTEQLQQLGVEVLWHPWLADPVAWFEQNAARFEHIIVSRHYILSSYLDLVRRYAPRAQLIFDTVDLHYLREQRAAELADRDDLRRSAAETRNQELALINASDVTLVVSPVEQQLLAREAAKARVEVLSNVHEVFGCRRPFAERRDLMFVGGFQHPPNIDAVQWFVAEILPRVRAELPDLMFHLIGSRAPEAVVKLGEQPGVKFHGFVEDIEPFLDGCRIAVAPLRYGAGVKGKVNLSMSYGQPVVATPIAVEGMQLVANEDVLVAEDAAAFAAAILRLYADPALWQQLSQRGLDNVRQHFSFASARAALRQVLGLA